MAKLDTVGLIEQAIGKLVACPPQLAVEALAERRSITVGTNEPTAKDWRLNHMTPTTLCPGSPNPRNHSRPGEHLSPDTIRSHWITEFLIQATPQPIVKHLLRRTVMRPTKAEFSALTLAAILLLTACGNNSATMSTQSSSTGLNSDARTSQPTSTIATPPSYTTPTVQTVIQKTFGQWAGAGESCAGTPQSCDLTFTISKVTNCTGRYAGDPPPAGTTRKLIWLEVSLGSQYDSRDLPSGLVTQFTAINAAGVTSGNINPSTYWQCAPKGQGIGFGDENWLPGKKYAGAVEIYLPQDAVKISNGDGVWEWTLPR